MGICGPVAPEAQGRDFMADIWKPWDVNNWMRVFGFKGMQIFFGVL